MYTIKRQEIKTQAPFDEIFPVANDILNRVIENMRENGFDPQEPIVVWRNRYQRICVDGHTRLMAADGLGIQDIPVLEKLFDDEDAAIEYAIHRQRDRRNMTDADIARCVEAVDRSKRSGGDRKSEGFQKSKASGDAFDSGKSAKETAKIVGVSQSKVERFRTVQKHADDETKEAVKAGEMSINKAYTATQERRKGVMQGKTQDQTKKNRVVVREKVLNPVSHAYQFVVMAKTHLEGIYFDDPEKDNAFSEMVIWCFNQIKDTDKAIETSKATNDLLKQRGI